ncbi:MAG: DUF4321 domain-containing protein [Chitinivibrionales bacterium]|nr:DUF4321 domain-containing protein [Chitinivibrionales bacterium]
MAIIPKNRKLGTMVLVVILGLLIGSYLNLFVRALLPEGNVVRTIFATSVPFGVGDFVHNDPVVIDLRAIRFQFGFQVDFSLLSVLGVFISLYFFRWYE